MRFLATTAQVAQMAANAVNASIPVGMGRIHFQDREYKPDEFMIADDGIDLDYVGGRMVKLRIKRTGPDEWDVANTMGAPDPDYQSWVTVYPTFESLIESAGGVV